MTERVLFESLTGPLASADGRVTLHGPAAHHLARVCRCRVGDAVELFDGRGTVSTAIIEEISANRVRLTHAALRPGVVADTSQVTLIQGVPKGDKLDTVVRQATEMGVAAVWPVFTERSVPKPRADRADARTERLTRIAEEAARQSGRADVPRVFDACALIDALTRLDGEGLVARAVAWEQSTNPFSAVVKTLPTGAFALLVGPEGGLSEAEVDTAKSQGFHDVSLGRRVLRTETAPIAALAMLSLLRGDLGQW